MFIGAAITVIIALGAGAFFFVLPRLGSHAAAVNMNCTLIVPPQPLSATGLATPYQLVATDPDNGPCNEANPNQAAFVQGAVINTATGQISVYDPLVIDKGTQPAIAPVVPQLPQGAVIAIWFGFNGNQLRLRSVQNSLNDGQCVNGIHGPINGSIFGQVGYCNAPTFFQAANQAIQRGQLHPPALGKAKDGLTCPSVRDFSVVDMDQSDNVTTAYLVTGNGQTAQMTAANAQQLQNAQTQVNGSDNRLLAIAIDGSLGCQPWMAPDLANPGQMATALPLDELQAAAQQQAPIALVPSRDDMVVVNGQQNLQKINAYRLGVNQQLAPNLGAANTKAYCTNLRQIAPARLLLDSTFTITAPSLAPAMANNLFTFLAQRFVATYGPNGLNCVGLLDMPDPVSVRTDENGVAISATINGVTPGASGGSGSANTPTCNVNGTTLADCAGTTTINGQSCTFSFANNTVTVVCPSTRQQPPAGNQQNGNN